MVVTATLPSLKGSPAPSLEKLNTSPEFPDVQACRTSEHGRLLVALSEMSEQWTHPSSTWIVLDGGGTMAPEVQAFTWTNFQDTKALFYTDHLQLLLLRKTTAAHLTKPSVN